MEGGFLVLHKKVIIISITVVLIIIATISTFFIVKYYHIYYCFTIINGNFWNFFLKLLTNLFFMMYNILVNTSRGGAVGSSQGS